jgi:hypothetical protein
MYFMNEDEIEEAAIRFRTHPVLGPATATLFNLVGAVNANSDGWAYWSKPVHAAKRLMTLIHGDGSWEARNGNGPTITHDQLKKAYIPLKAFRTRSGIHFDIIEPEGR